MLRFPWRTSSTRTEPRKPGALLAALVLILLLPACSEAAGSDAQAPAPDPRLRVLFLGDQGHHLPSERLHSVYGALARQGIAVDYRDQLSQVDADLLRLYDVVWVYANYARLTRPPQEFFSDLTAFVEGGGGLVALHCASACFPESESWEKLLGGRFLSHETGVLHERVVAAEHPLMKGYEEFESWDESYVHRHHQDGRTTLTMRDDEAWTWVRAQGQGRVFYSAWGHDQRTWEQPGFLELLRRALRWSAGEDAQRRHDAFDLPPLQLEPRPTVQNYEKREQQPHYQLPLSPTDALGHLQTAAGLRAEIFASEPDITNPIAMSWDHRGRLWVLESIDYPNRVEDDGVGRDRIVICEDTGRDGRADKFTTFVEGLNIPTGILCVNGGVLVAQAPSMLRLIDDDGDDRCDRRVELLHGFGRSDTHAGPSNLHLGFDNWIYGVVGYSGFRGEVAGQSVAFNSGLFRFRFDGSALQFVAQFTNNSWGIGMRSDGELFGSTANNAPSFFVGAPKPDLAHVDTRHPGASAIQTFYPLHPATAVIRQVDVFGGYTSAAGHHFATGALLPAEWSDRIAFICEPTANLVAMFRVEADGAGFRADDGWNLVASTDEWFSPVQAQVGPDGAVWIADWYEFIVQHNPTPTPQRGGFQSSTGKGNAHENPLRDRAHGRILRLVPFDPAEEEEEAAARAARSESRLPAPRQDLSQASISQRLAVLRHPNLFWRLTAQHLLAQIAIPEMVPVLQQMVAEGGLGAVHALGLLDSLGALGVGGAAHHSLRAALASPEAALRKSALRLLPPDSGAALVDAGILQDPDPAVRRMALLAAARVNSSLEIGTLIGAYAARGMEEDPWLAVATRAAALRHAAGFLAGAGPALMAASAPEAQESPNLVPNPGFEAQAVWQPRTYGGSAEHHWVEEGRNGGFCLRIDSASGSDTSWFADVEVQPSTRYRLTGWVRTAELEVVGERADGALFNLHARGRSISNAILGDHDWTQLALEFETGANESQLSVNCLFGGWGHCRGTAWFDDLELRALGRSGTPHSLALEAAAHLARVGPAAERADLQEALTQGRVRLPADVLLQLHLDAGVESASSQPLHQGGDAEAGRTLFAQHPIAACIRCHKVEGSGGEVGPDLSAVGERLSAEELLQSILEPNAAIAADYPGQVSPMPPMRAFLSDGEIRDLVAYLAACRQDQGG